MKLYILFKKISWFEIFYYLFTLKVIENYRNLLNFIEKIFKNNNYYNRKLFFNNKLINYKFTILIHYFVILFILFSFDCVLIYEVYKDDIYIYRIGINKI